MGTRAVKVRLLQKFPGEAEVTEYFFSYMKLLEHLKIYSVIKRIWFIN